MTNDNLEEKNLKKDYSIPISIFLSSLILAGAWIYTKGLNAPGSSQLSAVNLEQSAKSAELPAVWGDLGAKMISAGVIDAEKFERLAASFGLFNPDFLKSVNRAENDYHSGRTKKISSLRSLRRKL